MLLHKFNYVSEIPAKLSCRYDERDFRKSLSNYVQPFVMLDVESMTSYYRILIIVHIINGEGKVSHVLNVALTGEESTCLNFVQI